MSNFIYIDKYGNVVNKLNASSQDQYKSLEAEENELLQQQQNAAMFRLKEKAKAVKRSGYTEEELGSKVRAQNLSMDHAYQPSVEPNITTKGGDVIGSQPMVGDSSSMTGMSDGQMGSLISMGGQLAASTDSSGEGAGTVAGETAKGAAIGTQILPGWGTAIGAVVGTVGGLAKIKANRKARIAKAKEKSFREIANIQQKLADDKAKGFQNLMSVMQQAFLGGRR